jgi:hypothetical protein
MPPKDSVRVLEGALPKAATPKLRAAIEATIARSSKGSPTWNDLQSQYWHKMK